MEQWYQVWKYPKSFGFAAKDGRVTKAGPELQWAIGKKLEDIRFWFTKPCIVTKIETNE